MTTNNNDTDNVLKNSENFNILEGYVKMDNPLHKIKLPEPKDFTIKFQFKDGEEVVFKEAKSLQEFIDKMNNLHELEKENMRLKELLEECRDGLEKIKRIGQAKKLGAVYQIAERTLAKTEEVQG